MKKAAQCPGRPRHSLDDVGDATILAVRRQWTLKPTRPEPATSRVQLAGSGIVALSASALPAASTRRPAGPTSFSVMKVSVLTPKTNARLPAPKAVNEVKPAALVEMTVPLSKIDGTKPSAANCPGTPSRIHTRDVAMAFKAKQAGAMTPVLDALTAIGIARPLADGRYAAWAHLAPLPATYPHPSGGCRHSRQMARHSSPLSSYGGDRSTLETVICLCGLQPSHLH